jgi:hypothetical protein
MKSCVADEGFTAQRKISLAGRGAPMAPRRRESSMAIPITVAPSS